VRVVQEVGSAEGRGPFARGIGGIPQFLKSPKIGGYRGLKRAFVNALPRQIVRGGFDG